MVYFVLIEHGMHTIYPYPLWGFRISHPQNVPQSCAEYFDLKATKILCTQEKLLPSLDYL